MLVFRNALLSTDMSMGLSCHDRSEVSYPRRRIRGVVRQAHGGQGVRMEDKIVAASKIFTMKKVKYVDVYFNFFTDM